VNCHKAGPDAQPLHEGQSREAAQSPEGAEEKYEARGTDGHVFRPVGAPSYSAFNPWLALWATFLTPPRG